MKNNIILFLSSRMNLLILYVMMWFLIVYTVWDYLSIGEICLLALFVFITNFISHTVGVSKGMLAAFTQRKWWEDFSKFSKSLDREEKEMTDIFKQMRRDMDEKDIN